MFKPSAHGGLAAAMLVLFCGIAAGAGAEERTVHFHVDPADLAWTASPEGYHPQLTDAVAACKPGRLDLPLIPVTVLPPDGQRLAGVDVVSLAARPVTPPGRLAVYRSDDGPAPGEALLPQETLVRVGSGGYARGERVDGFVVAPLRPAPGGGWELVHDVDIILVFEPDPATDVARPLRGRRGLDDRWLPGRIMDLRDRPTATAASLASRPDRDASAPGEAFDPRFNPSLDGSPVDYVIVTSDALAGEFERFAEWKTASGTPAVVRTVEWIRENYPAGADLQERIRAFIRDAVVHWGTEWVLLGGDTPILPPRYGRTTYYGGERIPTDLYFQCLDGSWNGDGDDYFGEGYRSATYSGDGADLVPDVWIGRLPVNTVEEARIELDKILDYERQPPVDAGYPVSNLMLAEVLFPRNWSADDTVVWDGADLAEETLARFPLDFSSRRLYENSPAFPGAEPETLSSAIAAINEGFGLINHIGHGYIQNMAVGLGGLSITIPDVDAFTNGDRTSVLYAINCTSAAFDFDCIAEHFLNHPNGGGVACVGATRYDFPGTSHFYSLEFYDLIFSDGVDRLGEAASLAKVPFVSLSADDNAHRWTQYTLVYLGDPHMRLWTESPATLAVTHDASTALGENPVTVVVESGGVPVDGARVTLYKAGETFATALTDAAGEALLTARPRSEGDLSVTVTARNALPYRGTMAVTAATGPYPRVTALAVDDSESDPANGDGLLEAGEAARVTFTIGNAGAAALSGVSVSALDSGPLTFASVGSGAGSLAAGAEAAFGFDVDVAPDAGDLATVVVALQVEADQGTWAPRAVLYVGAPELGLYELTVEEASGDGDGVLEESETAALTPRLINAGAGEGLDLAGSLTLLQANGATVLNGDIDFGAIGPGAVSAADPPDPLLVKIGRDGELPTLRLTVSDAIGPRLTTPLDLEAPEPPSGVKAEGEKDRIALEWTPSPSADVARYVVYRAENPEGPYERLSGFQDHAVSLLVDDTLSGLAIRYYRVAAQDTSGNLSPLSAEARGITNLPLLPGFPVPAALGTQASPTTVDLDGDGRLEIITGREEIYVLRADGSEVRDGDNDPLTIGPWTDVRPENGFWASPAVGDLDGDGRLEVVAVSFLEGEVYVWDDRGHLLPGWPQATDHGSVIAIGTPALADLTGDGLPEIVLHAGMSLYAFDRFGNEVADGDGDPSTHGVLFHTGSQYSYGSVGAADFDNDGKAEIVMPTRGAISSNPNHGQLYLLDDDGTPMPGWPITFRGAVTSSPAIADLNRDGVLDIIVATGSDSVEVRTRNGSSVPGWPQSTLMNQDIMCSPGVADVDRDGSLDVAIISGNGTISLWHADGTLFSGFPYEYTDPLENRIPARGSPSLVNLDEDDDLELLTGNIKGGVLALNHDGTIADGFPLQLNGPADGGILVLDLDGDGMNEMAISCFDRSVYVYQTNGRVTGDPGWPMFRHDPRRTGFLEAPLTEAVVPQLHLAVLQSDQLPGLGTAYAVATRDLQSPVALSLDGEPLSVEEIDPDRRFYRAVTPLEPGSHVLTASGTAVDGVTGGNQKSFDVVAAPSVRGWLAATSGVRVWADRTEGWPDRLLVVRWTGNETGAGAAFMPPAEGGVLVQVGPSNRAAPAGTRIEFTRPESWPGASVRHWDGTTWRAVASSPAGAHAAVAVVDAFGWFLLAPGPGGGGGLPARLVVGSPRPNPSPGSTRIAFSLSAEAHVRADLFDIRGARVRRLADTVYPAGEHELLWTGRDNRDRLLPGGVYFLRVCGGDGAVTRKLVRVIEGGGR